MDLPKASHYLQLTSLSAATPLSEIPLGVRKADIQAEAQDIRWRADGVDPSSTVGMVLAKGTTITWDITENGPLSKLKFFQTTSGGILNVTYYGALPIFHARGAPAVGTITCAGTGTVSASGTGDLAVGTVTASGTGVSSNFVGTGSLSVGTITGAGTGTVS